MFKGYIIHIYESIQVSDQMRNRRACNRLPLPDMTGSLTPDLLPTKIQ